MALFMCKPSGIKLVPWSIGSDADIKAMVDAYYAGDLTLSDIQSVWSIGDERTVSLSSMLADGVGESHVAQSVTMVILDWNKKVLSSDHTTPVLALVGQKNVLANGNTRESGYMNPTATNSGGWRDCARRTWCNNVYYNALPSTFRSLLKEFDNVSYLCKAVPYGTSRTVTTADKVAFMANVEMNSSNVQTGTEVEGQVIEYYRSQSHRIKYVGDASSTAAYYWVRTSYMGDEKKFAQVSQWGASGPPGSNASDDDVSIAPFFCI